jgi:ubiquinone/menaquinone biosynthesis C-methylase UbiE
LIGLIYIFKGIIFKIKIMGIEEQGAKPKGASGRFMGKLMNFFHTGFYRSYFKNIEFDDNAKLLDIGCGGGKFLQYLHKRNQKMKLCGLDHSPEMVELSCKINAQAIVLGKMELFNASVLNIPLPDNTQDWATAFETIQFWPNIDDGIKEVVRVLKPGGVFVVINRYPKQGSKWWDLASLKSVDDYKNCFESNGFIKVDCDLAFKKGWIVVRAIKS